MLASTNSDETDPVIDDSRDRRSIAKYGGAWLLAALLFFAWARFDWAIFLAGAIPILTARPFYSRGGSASQGLPSKPARDVTAGPRRWQIFGLIALSIAFAALALWRIMLIANGEPIPFAASPAERWLPLLLTAPVPIWFVMSGVMRRAPSEWIPGAIGLTGALVGSLLGLAWRDSIVLAAAIFGVALLGTVVILAKGTQTSPRA